MPIAQSYASRKFNGEKYKLVFVVGDCSEILEVNGFEVFSEKKFYSISSIKKYFNVAIADSYLREKIVNDAMRNGVEPFECYAENVTMFDFNNIGEGAILSPSVIITSNITIGRFFHANMMSYVAHDCVIGDFVTFGPSVHCNGNVVIHDHVYIGSGAVLKHGTASKPLVIGKGAIIGMGAVVTKDVAPGVVVVGNPAHPIRKK